MTRQGYINFEKVASLKMQQTILHSLKYLRQIERFLAGDSSPVEHHFLEGTY